MGYLRQMSRVFTSGSTGAAVYVFSDDHCPPHVHARHRGEGWIARVKFSFLGAALELMSIAPSKVVPFHRVINRLFIDIGNALHACRRGWWAARQTTCLANQWAVVLAPGRIEPSSERHPGARQITEAGYDPDRQRLQLAFYDGTTANVSTEP
jgi:hypothetical protein